MSLSLASSIFGQNDKEDKGDKALTSLFESSAKLPPKRNLPPAEPKKKPRGKEPEITTVAAKGESTRKKRTKKSSSADHSGQAAESKKERGPNEKDETKTKSSRKRKAEENPVVGDQESPDKTKESNRDDQSNDDANEQGNEEETDDIPSAEANGGQQLDADAEKRTVFVGNLPLSMTRKKLASMFSRCGQVESTRFRSVPVKGVKLPPQSAGNQVCAHSS